MAIKFIVKELNKPSQFALTNLSQSVYNFLDTCSDNNNTTTKNGSAETKQMGKTA
ncbi:hypothetical protein [Acidilutibacter cellobiosedens]|uniref:hypothetical protein n=1 Tax=Acidilutibacter cellobiosedens TaxID=2507161 RepID=UPI001375E383|nr:hypothetical protein [Acidilutibacter cellobiosedens]